MKKLLILSLVALAPFASMFAEEDQSGYILSHKEPSQIIFNNKLLVRINGKSISLIDVIKKMNLFIYQNYPNLFESKISLYQFYSSNWVATLDEMINNELILAEAKEKEVKVSDGDVREEMEERFGPNIMAKLDTLNLQYEEAKEMIHSELLIRQLLWYKVHARALQRVTPATIKESYKNYQVSNPSVEEWTYQVLSIRGKNAKQCEEIASKASGLIKSGSKDFESLTTSLKKNLSYSEKEIQISISDDFKVNSKSISQQHFEALSNLPIDGFSAPISQVSRVDKSEVYRIFHLKEYKKENPSSFQEISDNLKQELLDRALVEEKTKYIKHLEKKFNFDRESIKREFVTNNYQPFSIK